jgi:transcriptional regulator with XRE-family HTH domain
MGFVSEGFEDGDRLVDGGSIVSSAEFVQGGHHDSSSTLMVLLELSVNLSAINVKLDDMVNKSDGDVSSAGDVVARNVRRIRQEKQMSLGELGRLSGLAKQTVSKLEQGEGNPTVDTLARLSNALGTSLRSLVTELGSDVRVQHLSEAAWTDLGAGDLRTLDQIYGSGYVWSAILRIDSANGPLLREARGRGSLNLVYVISGRARVGPDGDSVEVSTGDFVRFPAEKPHAFESLSGETVFHVVTTSLQLTRTGVVGRLLESPL